MKKKFTRLVIGALSCCLISTSLIGCGKDNADKTSYAEIPELPSYTEVAKDYDFFAYSGPMNGSYYMDGEIVENVGPDQRTVEGYTTFKDAGFNVAFLSGTAAYEGGDWKTSECNRAATAAREAGIDRFMLNDGRILALQEEKGGLVGSGKRFETFEALVETVKGYLDDYAGEKGFYGVNLRDEPDYTYTLVTGEVYKAVEEAAKQLGIDDIYIHFNLLGLAPVRYPYFAEFPNGDANEYLNNVGTYYTNYVKGYMEATGAKRISSDVYIARINSVTEYLHPAFYYTVQTLINAAKEYGAKVSFCLSSFEMLDNGQPLFRRSSKSEMLLELYSLMGMGIDDFAYYTYQVAESRRSTIQWRDESCFLNDKGEKTSVYYYGQEAMANAQAMSDVILNYEYQGGKFYMNKPANFDNSPYLGGVGYTFDNTYTFNKLKNLTFDNDVVFVTELKDSVNNLYMYMLQNVIDPANAKRGQTAETITADFGTEFTHVAELKDGRLEYVKLNDGKYTKTLSAGHAVYLVPIK